MRHIERQNLEYYREWYRNLSPEKKEARQERRRKAKEERENK